jgi:hypothetical protein
MTRPPHVAQGRGVLHDIFLWEDGSFEFTDGALPDMKMVPPRST